MEEFTHANFRCNSGFCFFFRGPESLPILGESNVIQIYGDFEGFPESNNA